MIPEDFDQIGRIEDLSIAVTRLQVERESLAFTNIANATIDDRIALGMRIAVNEAKMIKAKTALRAAQELYAEG